MNTDERLDSMRHFLQPTWSTLPYSQKGHLRRRAFPQHIEYELCVEMDEGSFVVPMYQLRNLDLVGLSFGDSLQPIRSLIFGPVSSKGAQAAIRYFSETRPSFMAAVSRGINLDFSSGGGFWTHRDIADGRSKVLYAVRLSDDLMGRFDGGLFDDIYGALLIASLEIWFEASQPIDAGVFVSDRTDWNDAIERAGLGAKWVVENADNIRLIGRFLGLG